MYLCNLFVSTKDTPTIVRSLPFEEISGPGASQNIKIEEEELRIHD